MDAVIIVFLWGIILGLTLTAAVMIVWNKVLIHRIYNYTITLKEIVSGRTITKSTRARIRSGKGKANTFAFQGGGFSNLKAPIPPDSCIEVTSRGNKYAMGYVIDKDQVVWAEDTLDLMNWAKDSKTIESKLKPFTQEQRQIWINQEKKAARDKQWSLGEIFAVAAPSMMVLIVFIVALVFWEDVTNPMLKAQSNQEEFIQTQKEMVIEMQKLAKIYHGVEVIETDDIPLIDSRQDLEEKT